MSSQDKLVSSGGPSDLGPPAKEKVPEGEGAPDGSTTPGCDEGPSGDATELKVLTMGDQATSIFQSAIRETLRIKKMDGREKYAPYMSICFLSLKLRRDRAIGNLYNAVIVMMRNIMTQTGWVTTLLTGGPRPSLGGDLDLLM